MTKEDYYDSVDNEIEALEDLTDEPYEIKDSEIRIFRGRNVLE